MPRASSTSLLLALLAGTAVAQEKTTYDDHIRPIFAARCLNCHNADRKKGDLDLSSYRTTMAGSSGGPIVSAGDDASSALAGVVSHTRQPIMPPEGGKLPDADIARIRAWIVGGCLENAGSKPVAAKAKLTLGASTDTAIVESGPLRMPLDPLPPTPRSGPALDLASHPSLPVIALASPKQILLYDLDQQAVVGAVPFPQGSPRHIAFLADGRHLLACGGEEGAAGRVYLWNLPAGDLAASWGDDVDVILAADLRPSRDRLAYGGPFRIVKILDTATGEVQARVTKHTDWITAVAYSPDGVLLATADRAGGLHVWEAESTELYLSLRGHDGAINSLSWSPDSNILASASEDGRVRLWEMNEGKLAKEWKAHGPGVRSVRILKNGQILTTGRDRATKLWNTDGGEQKSLPQTSDLPLAAVADPAISRVAVADYSGNIRVYPIADGAPSFTLTTNPVTLDTRLKRAETRLRTAADAANATMVRVEQTRAKLAAAQGQKTAAQSAADDFSRRHTEQETSRAALAALADTTRVALQQAEAALEAALKESADAAAALTADLATFKTRTEEDVSALAQLSEALDTAAATEQARVKAVALAASSDTPEHRAAAESAQQNAQAASTALEQAQARSVATGEGLRVALESYERAKQRVQQAEATKAQTIARRDESSVASAAAAAALKASDDAITGLAQSLAAARSALAEAEAAVGAITNELNPLDAQLTRETAELRSAELERARCEAGALRRRLDTHQRQLVELRAKLEMEDAQAESLGAMTDAAEQAAEKAQQESDAATEQLRMSAAREVELAALQKEQQSLVETIQGTITSQGVLLQQAMDLVSALSRDQGMTEAATSAQRTLDAVRSAHDGAKSQLGEVTARLSAIDSERAKLLSERPRLEESLTTWPARLAALHSARDEARAAEQAALRAAGGTAALVESTEMELEEIAAEYEAALRAAGGT